MVNNIMDMHLSELAAQEEIARANGFKQAWNWYFGRHPKPLKVRPGKTDDNVIVNYCGPLVDTGVDFLFGKDVTFELADAEGKQTAAGDWLAQVWKRNRQGTTLTKLAMNGGVTGQVFIKIVPQPGDVPRLIVLDPATVTPRWDPQDIENVLYYKVEYTAIDPNTGKKWAYRQILQPAGPYWRIDDYQRPADQSRWQQTGSQVHPYAWAPIVDCQTLPAPNDYWGRSDIEADVQAVQRSINFTVSNIGRILGFWAHPKTWGRGFTAQQLDAAIDEVLILTSKDAELQNLEMVSDLSSSIEYLKQLKSGLHEVSRTPEIAVGKVEDLGPLSGVALSILFAPLLAKTTTKRRTYGDMLAELNRRLLDLGGFGDQVEVMTHWPEPLPSDPAAERNVALIDQQLGVSKDTILTKLGYDADMEKEKRASEAQDALAAGQSMLQAFDRGQGNIGAGAGAGQQGQNQQQQGQQQQQGK